MYTHPIIPKCTRLQWNSVKTLAPVCAVSTMNIQNEQTRSEPDLETWKTGIELEVPITRTHDVDNPLNRNNWKLRAGVGGRGWSMWGEYGESNRPLSHWEPSAANMRQVGGSSGWVLVAGEWHPGFPVSYRRVTDSGNARNAPGPASLSSPVLKNHFSLYFRPLIRATANYFRIMLIRLEREKRER